MLNIKYVLKAMYIIRKDSILADLLMENHFLIFVIENFGIRLGLQNKTIEEICNEYSIDLTIFIAILSLHYNPKSSIVDIFDIELLCNTPSKVEQILKYLDKSHSYFIKEIIPEISDAISEMTKKSTVNGIKLVKEFFDTYSDEVSRHFDYETNTAFPYILSLIKQREGYENYSVADYKSGHDNIEEKLEDLKSLLIKHLPENENCIHRRKILDLLFHLERDMNLHAKIENEILVPIVEQLELAIDGKTI
jgi:regulator of cell morphogenesis and NO signaling